MRGKILLRCGASSRAIEAWSCGVGVWKCLVVFLVLSLCVGLSGRVSGQVDSLWQRIDRAAQADMPWLTAGPLDETLALRRLSLDLRNIVPTLEEIDAFLAEPAQDRWARWVDKFLEDPLHRERLVDWYDKTLLQRRPYQQVDRATWISFLRGAVDDKTPLDQLLRGLVQSPWWNKTARAQQRFFLERGGDAHAIARDLGRVFFGKDMQCAQCHDHPQVEDYLQIDYHGLLALVSTSSLAEGKTTDDKGAELKLQMYIEKAAGDAPFESVFNKGVPFRSATRLPGQTEHFEAYLAPDQRYEPSPAEGSFAGLPNRPVQSRRMLLASQLLPSNRAFSENWANRLWAIMFGRGLVHPLDMHHFDNPPSNPQLLAILTDSLVEAKFDVTAILRQIALSETYKRGRQLPIDSIVDSHGTVQLQAPDASAWKAQLIEAVLAAQAALVPAESLWKDKQTLYESAATAWREIQKSRIALRAELDTQEAGFNEANKKLSEAQAGLDKASVNHRNLVQKVALLDEAVGKLQQAKALGDDPEIQSSIAATLTKIESLKPQIAAAQQAIDAASMARDSATAVLETKRGEWKAVVDRLTPVEQQLHQSDLAMVQARDAFQSARRSSAVLSERLQRLQRVALWFDQSAQSASSQAQLAQLATQMQPMQESLTASINEQLAIEQGMAKLLLAIAENNKAMEPVSGKWKELVDQKEKLSVTKTQLAQTKGLVADPTAIDAALAQIDASLVARDAQLGTVDTQLKQMQVANGQMEKNVQDSKTQLADAMSKTQAQQMALEQHKAMMLGVQNQLDKQTQQCADLRQDVLRDCQSVFSIAPERALSPEQFGWSILAATSIHANYIANEKAEMDKNSPVGSDVPPEQLAIQQRARLLQALRAARDKLQGNIDTFSNLYSSGVGQTSDDFFASPDQALFVANGGSVYGWAAPSGSNLSNQAIQTADSQGATQLMIKGLLARQANEKELQWMTELLNTTPEARPAVIHELVWGILAGVEFRLYP